MRGGPRSGRRRTVLGTAVRRASPARDAATHSWSLRPGLGTPYAAVLGTAVAVTILPMPLPGRPTPSPIADLAHVHRLDEWARGRLMHAFADALAARGWQVTRIPVTDGRVDVLATAGDGPVRHALDAPRHGAAVHPAAPRRDAAPRPRLVRREGDRRGDARAPRSGCARADDRWRCCSSSARRRRTTARTPPTRGRARPASAASRS